MNYILIQTPKELRSTTNCCSPTTNTQNTTCCPFMLSLWIFLSFSLLMIITDTTAMFLHYTLIYPMDITLTIFPPLLYYYIWSISGPTKSISHIYSTVLQVTAFSLLLLKMLLFFLDGIVVMSRISITHVNPWEYYPSLLLMLPIILSQYICCYAALYQLSLTPIDSQQLSINYNTTYNMSWIENKADERIWCVYQTIK